jgi:CRISPR-associated exonuclease Cas4
MQFALAAGLLLAVALLILAAALRRASGLPPGTVAYDDAGASGKVIRAARYGLAGKPDYLLRQGDDVIPFELKPKRTASLPYRSDVLQVAAYGLLVEARFGKWPSHGVVGYRSANHEVAFTGELRSELLAVMAAMRADLDRDDVEPNHHSAARCKACGLRQACGRAWTE